MENRTTDISRRTDKEQMKTERTTKTICQSRFRCGQQSLLPIAIADLNWDHWQVDIVGKIGYHSKTETDTIEYKNFKQL